MDNIQLSNGMYLIGRFNDKKTFVGDGVIVCKDNIVFVGDWSRKILFFDFRKGGCMSALKHLQTFI